MTTTYKLNQRKLPTAYSEAEIWLTERLMEFYGRAFVVNTEVCFDLGTTESVTCEVDAATPDRMVLAEVWSHIGRPKGDQPTKVIADAAKLRWIKEEMEARHWGTPKVVIVAGDREAVAPHRVGSGWRAWGLAKDNIDILVFDFPDDIRAAIQAEVMKNSASARVKGGHRSTATKRARTILRKGATVTSR